MYARYYDGKQAKPYQVTLGATALGISFRSQDRPPKNGQWSYSGIRILETPKEGFAFVLSHTDAKGARLEIEDTEFIERIKDHLPRQAWKQPVLSASKKNLFALIIGAAAVVVMVFYAPTLFAPVLAPHIPGDWRSAAGKYIAEELADQGGFCHTEEGDAALQILTARLTEHMAGDILLEVRVARNDIANAFAAPGGQIVFFSGLIDAAESQEDVAGVLAHEIGHAIALHPTEGIIRIAGTGLLLQFIFGDSSALINLAYVSQQFLELAHSRDAEREADSIALTLLKQANIDNRGLLNFFTYLAEKEQEGGAAESSANLDAMKYLSSHPATEDRIAAIRAFGRDYPKRSILTASQWQALKGICDEK